LSFLIVLTPAGRHYLPYINEALSKIAQGTDEILPNNRDSHETPALLASSSQDFDGCRGSQPAD
jgi:DNA-binding transcriptional LysR family regulator